MHPLEQKALDALCPRDRRIRDAIVTELDRQYQEVKMGAWVGDDLGTAISVDGEIDLMELVAAIVKGINAA